MAHHRHDGVVSQYDNIIKVYIYINDKRTRNRETTDGSHCSRVSWTSRSARAVWGRRTWRSSLTPSNRIIIRFAWNTRRVRFAN